MYNFQCQDTEVIGEFNDHVPDCQHGGHSVTGGNSDKPVLDWTSFILSVGLERQSFVGSSSLKVGFFRVCSVKVQSCFL